MAIDDLLKDVKKKGKEEKLEKYLPIEQHIGRCSYCGNVKNLNWKDKNGYYLCNDCKSDLE